MRGLIHKPIASAKALLPGVANPGGKTASQLTRELLETAHTWFDAKDISTGAEQTLANRGTDTAVATIGSSTSSDTNDPVLLPHDGTDYFWTPGTGGNDVLATAYALDSSEDSIDLVVRMTVPPQVAGATNYAWGIGAGSRVGLGITGDGRVVATVRTVSPTTITPFSNVIGTFSEGDIVWVRARWAGSTWAYLEYSEQQVTDVDDVVWVDPGISSGNNTGALNSLIDSASLQFGNLSTTDRAATRVYWASVTQDGRTDDLIFDPTIADPTGTTWTGANSNTMRIRRTTTGLQSVLVNRSTLVTDGVDDYVQTSVNPVFTSSTGKHTFIVVVRTHNTPTSGQILSTESEAWEGLSIYSTGAGEVGINLGDDANTFAFATSASSYEDGSLIAIAVTLDEGTATAYIADETAQTIDYSGLIAFTNGAVRLGVRSYGVAQPHSGNLYGFVYFDDAISSDQITLITDYLKAGAYS